MLELTWEEKIKLNDGTERKFINDNDTVIMKGSVKMDRYALASRSSSKLLPRQEIIDIQDRFE
jgi:fumarylacetoacetase